MGAYVSQHDQAATRAEGANCVREGYITTRDACKELSRLACPCVYSNLENIRSAGEYWKEEFCPCYKQLEERWREEEERERQRRLQYGEPAGSQMSVRSPGIMSSAFFGYPSEPLGPGLTGMTNIGNTCFMNTGLQCLCHIQPLAQYFLKERHQEASKIRDLDLAEGYASLMQSLWAGTKAVHNPKALHRLFCKKAPWLFDGYQQQDVQEFLAFFLDALHEELNLVKKRPPPITEEAEKEDERIGEEGGDEFKAALAWLRYLQRGKSFLVDLLQGQARDVISCEMCNFESRSFQAFLYLSVPVASYMKTVGDAIDKFMEEERLTGDEQWRCPRCKAKVDARKRIDLWKLPHVLVLHLKRFEFDVRAMRFRKLSADLQVPLAFDLSPYVSSEQRESAVYDVVAVANHHGAFGSGHYTANCLVRDPEQEGAAGKWYTFDDGRVYSIGGDRVITKDAYVIFLERRVVDRKSLIRKQSVSRPEHWPHMVSTRNSVLQRVLPRMPPPVKQKTGTTDMTTKVQSPPADVQARAFAMSPSVGSWLTPRLDALDQLLPGVEPAEALGRTELPAEVHKSVSRNTSMSTGVSLANKKRTANSLRPEDAMSVRHDLESSEVGPHSPLLTGSVDSLSHLHAGDHQRYGDGEVAAADKDVEVDQGLVSSFVAAGLDRGNVAMAVRRSMNDPHKAAAILSLMAGD